MKKMRKWVLLSFLLVPLLALTPSCSSDDSSSGSFGITFIPWVDMAVTDFDFATDGVNFEQPAVYLYFDVLNDPDGGLQDPDVVLDFTNSGLDWPRHPHFVGDDLFLGTGNGSTGIQIYRDYRSLSDGAVPDFELTDNGGGGGTWTETHGFTVGGGDLYGNDYGNSRVLIFNDIDAITADQAPDVALTMSIVSPDGIYYDAGDDQLYVGHNTNTLTDECVTRYDSASAITADQAPDAVLGVDVSFFEIGLCRKVYVNEDTDKLYVTTDEFDHGNSAYVSFIFQFDDAGSFANDALPSAIVGNNGAHTLAPSVMHIFNNRLWVANKNADEDQQCVPGPAITGFDFDFDGNITAGQDPDQRLGLSSSVAHSQSMAYAGGFLFVQNFAGCDDFAGTGDIYIFNAQNGGPFTDDPPFLHIQSMKDFGTAVAVDAIEVDQTTF